MKQFKLLSMMMLAVMTLSLMPSCSKDEDGGSGENTKTNSNN